jgi:hypothetical protein
MHLVGYLYEDYHDTRSLEHKCTDLQALEKFLTFTAPEGSLALRQVQFCGCKHCYILMSTINIVLGFSV